MSKPQVAIFVIMNDDLQKAEQSLLSLTKQTYVNFDITILFAGNKEEPFLKLRHLVDTFFPKAPIVKTEGNVHVPKTLNALIALKSTSFVSILSTGDVFHPERIWLCVEAAQERESSILITYAELLDHNGEVISADHPFFKSYTEGLLTNIAAHPCLSFAILWHDLILSPGNLFFSVKLFNEIGGFRDYEILYAYDFFLRASRLEEPTLLTDKTISCCPIHTDLHMCETSASIDERSDIIRDHLLNLLIKYPKNPFSDLFTAHPFMFASVNWPQSLANAVDGMIETRLPEKKVKYVYEQKPQKKGINKKNVTLLTHELSLSGAPVIVLELAVLLRQLNYSVNVISPIDGPLRDDFERRWISITILPYIPPRIESLSTILSSNLIFRLKRFDLIQWYGIKTLRVLRGIRLFQGKQKLFKLLRIVDGPFLINSVASWEWVYLSLQRRNIKVIWYIHETFDPKWMAHGSADKLFRRRIAEGSLTMLYGSDATRKVWTSEGYPGQVKYWSGISSDTYPGNQIRSLKVDREKRVILNVGTVGSRKGTRVLLEAFALGRRQGIIPGDVELCIVGCYLPSVNQEARDIFVRANKPDLQGFVRLVGVLYPDAISSYYDEADVYVHASFFDCMPIALLTAMARGLPVVATDADGCGEAIINEVSGLLVPPRNPQLLANAMAKLLNDTELSKLLSQGARSRFVNVFSTESTFEPVKNILDFNTSKRNYIANKSAGQRGENKEVVE